MLALETLLAAVGGILLGLGLGLTLGRRAGAAAVERPDVSVAPGRADVTLALSDTVPVERSSVAESGSRTVSQRPPARREG